jgi:hypothetical protein
VLKVTLHSFATCGSTSASTNSANLPETVSYSRLRWLLGMTITAIIAGRRLSVIMLSRMVGRYGAGLLSCMPIAS